VLGGDEGFQVRPFAPVDRTEKLGENGAVQGIRPADFHAPGVGRGLVLGVQLDPPGKEMLPVDLELLGPVDRPGGHPGF